MILAKPPKRGRKAPHPIRRGTLPRARVPNRHGDYRAKLKYGLKLWAKIIKANEPCAMCPRCWARPWVEAAHCFIKGRYRNVCLELDNGAPLCRVCHRIIDSDHLAKEQFFIERLGPDRYARLRLLSLSRSKMDLGLSLLNLESEARDAGIEG